MRTSGFGLLCPIVLLTAGGFANGEDDSPAPLLRVPDGFVIECVAAQPLVEYPMLGCFDDQGRLYVCDSAGLNLTAEELEERRPNVIRRLEDVDDDGRFDRSTVFADRMTFPQGAAWFDGALYVASPPSIWRLQDTDNDGIADIRDEIVTRFPFRGYAASIHGCFAGPNGRIYWTSGIYYGHDIVDQEGRSISKGTASRVFSCRPDGTDVQTFCGGGMANPVEVAFTAEGEMLGTMTFFENGPRYDALVHYVYGGVYPMDDEARLSEFRRTGPLLPAVRKYQGAVAPSGLTRYRGSQFGNDYRDNLFSTQFTTRKVVRHVLIRDDATFRVEDEDFLTTDFPDFRPCDVLEDADGSLLVIDTGAWFTRGCQSFESAKPQVHGAIYRIGRRGGPRPDDPRGLEMSWESGVDSLAARLDDPRPAVQDRAIAALAQVGDEATDALQSVLSDAKSSVVRRRNAIWALSRIDSPSARAALRTALGDPDAGVRQVAVRSLGTLRDAEASHALRHILAADAPQILRDAATALGRMGNADAVGDLLAASAQAKDQFLEHAIVDALIEINAREATAAGLSSPFPKTRRTALLALDQMDGGQLTRDQVTPLLDTDDQQLQQATLEVIGRHPTWSDEIAGLLANWLAEPELDDQRRAIVRGTLLAGVMEPEIQLLIGKALASDDTSDASRLLCLEVITRSRVKPLPAAWIEPLRVCLQSQDDQLVKQAIAAVSSAGSNEFDDVVAQLAGEQSPSVEIRVAAAGVVVQDGSPLSDQLYGFLASQCDQDTPPLLRLAASKALGDARLNEQQLTRMIQLVAEASPLELSSLLRAFQRSDDINSDTRDARRDIGLRLVGALEKSPALASLPATQLSRILATFPPAVQSAAESLSARLADDPEKQLAKLANLKPALAGGDSGQGRHVFSGTRTACAACHCVRGEGGRIGPDLTTIGTIRSRGELLEAIVLPSNSFARGFESFNVLVESGKIHSGIISRQTSSEIVLQTSERAEIRINAAEVEELQPSSVSVMPQGLETTMTIDELRDLLAYLESLK